MATNEDLRKAAVLLLSLSSRQRTQLLGRLEPQQAAAVVAEFSGLGEVASFEREAAVRDFAEANSPRLCDRRPMQSTPFRFLDDLPRDVLLHLLVDEHSQTIALVLSHLSPRKAAAILAELTPDQQFAVVCRIATMSPTRPEIAGDVERELRRRLLGATGRPAVSRGTAGVVRMLNVMEPAAERELLGKLSEADPQLAWEIRRAMFGDDVATCEDWSVSSAAG